MKKDRKSVEEKLKDIGYFKFADSENVFEDTFKDYQEDGQINFPWNGLNRIFSIDAEGIYEACLLYTSPSPRDRTRSRMPSSA